MSALQIRLALPSVFRPTEAAEPFAAARAQVADGAGFIAWRPAGALWEAAVVLEPEMPARAARLALLAGLVALADSLAVAAPAEKPLTLRHPDGLFLDGALAGAVRLDVTPGPELAAPAWMVLGARLRLAGPADPGLEPDRTDLATEGFQDTDAARLTEGWARHLMAVLADWQDGGLRALADRLLPRLPAEPGIRRALDPDGALRREPGGVTPPQASGAWERVA